GGGLDVDALGPEDRADTTEHAGTVGIVDEEVLALGTHVEAALVDPNDLLDLLQPGEGAGDAGARTVGRHRGDGDGAAVGLGLGAGLHRVGDAPLLRHLADVD